MYLSGNPSNAQAANVYTALNSTPADSTIYTFTSGATSISEIKEFKVSIFPNPVTDKLFIDLPSNISVSEIKIVDMNGRLFIKEYISESKKLDLDVTDLSKGIYTVTITGAEIIGMAKFVK